MSGKCTDPIYIFEPTGAFSRQKWLYCRVRNGTQLFFRGTDLHKIFLTRFHEQNPAQSCRYSRAREEQSESVPSVMFMWGRGFISSPYFFPLCNRLI